METREVATRLLGAALASGQVKLNPALPALPQLAALWKELRGLLKRPAPAGTPVERSKSVSGSGEPATGRKSRAKRK